MPEPRLALLPLMLEQYDAWAPGLRPAQETFLTSASEFLARFGSVSDPGICNTRAAVDAAVAAAERGGADLLVVLFLSYAPSLIALPALARTRLPLLLLNTTPRADMGPDIQASDYLENHAIHGVQDLANVLRRAGKQHGIVSGHLSDPAVAAALTEWAAAARALRLWQTLRVGRMGATFPGMGDFAVDATALLASGPEIVDLSPEVFRQAWERADAERVAALVQEYRSQYDTSAMSEEGLRSTASAELALRAVVEEARLGAIAFSFLIFEHLAGPTMPFVGASRLLAEGLGYSGEGDALGAAAVAVAHHLTGCAGFTEMFCPDWRRDEVLMSHMGEANPSLAAERPAMVEKDFLLGAGARPGVLLFRWQSGPATLASLTVGPEAHLRWVVTEGEIADSPRYPALDAPHCKFRPHLPLPDFLTAYSEAGGSHHLAVCPGRVASRFRRFADLAGLCCLQV